MATSSTTDPRSTAPPARPTPAPAMPQATAAATSTGVAGPPTMPTASPVPEVAAPNLAAASRRADRGADRPGADRPTSAHGRSLRTPTQLRDAIMGRLPELLGGFGAMLVVAAVAGFVVSSWDVLGNVGQAGLLAAGSAGLSFQAHWATGRDNAVLRRLVPLCWGAAAGLTLVAAQLVFDIVLPDVARLAVLGAGVAGLAHAGWAWREHPSSILLQLTSVATALYAVGPIGAGVDAGWDVVSWSGWAAAPIEALVTGTSDTGNDGLLMVAIGHTAIAVAWLLLGLRLRSVPAARVARVGGSILLGWAVLEFNAMVNPIGAAIALLLVIGFLIVGIALEDGLLISLGALAGLVTGLRTIWSLFTGQVAVTLTVAVAGVLMLAVAIQVARRRGTDGLDEPQ